MSSLRGGRCGETESIPQNITEWIVRVKAPSVSVGARQPGIAEAARPRRVVRRSVVTDGGSLANRYPHAAFPSASRPRPQPRGENCGTNDIQNVLLITGDWRRVQKVPKVNESHCNCSGLFINSLKIAEMPLLTIMPAKDISTYTGLG